MEYYKINLKNPDPVSITRAVEVLKEGGVIVYPTDTLYGLGVDMSNQKAVNKLLHLKRRNVQAPVSLMVDSVNSIEKIVKRISPKKKSLLNNLLPGKYTILLNNNQEEAMSRNNKLAWDYINQSRVGFRIPDNAVCRELSQQLQKPVSSTSANISGQGSVLSIQDVISQFGNKLDLILDAGSMKSTKGSTVIDLTKIPYLIHREGDISLQQLNALLPGVSFRKRKTEFLIVFICTGNICRSPIAEGIMRAMAERTKFRDIIRTRSAGTMDLGPVPAHDFSIKAADENEIDLSDHRAKKINTGIIEEASLIFCLAMEHMQYLKDHFASHKQKFHLLKDYGREKPLAVPSIADPIGHDLTVFRKTYSEIYTEIKRIFPFILNELKKFMEYNEIKES